MKMEIENITPAVAKAYLATSEGNRNLKHAHLASLVSMINSDQFVMNGSPIRFDQAGHLIDGHHRLNAIVIADRAVRMLVIRGISLEAKQTIDVGVPRSVADQLKIVRGEQHVALQVAYVNWALRLLTGHIVPIKTLDQFDDWSKVFGAGIKMVHDQNVHLTRFMRAAPVGAALAFAYKANPERITDLVNKLRDGENLKRTETAYTIREFLVRSATGEGKTETSKKVLAGCWAVIEDRPLSKLQVSDRALDFFREFYDRGNARKLSEQYKAAATEAKIHVDKQLGRNSHEAAA
jgi:hypothetical protein